MAWIYEPSQDRKHKRGWLSDEAGFIEGPTGEIIGKCPANLTEADASKLLNSDSIAYSNSRWPHQYPERVYNIYNGVLYRAKPTVPGKSYHGFPELSSEAERLPRKLKEQLLELARKRNCEVEIRKCLKGKS